jgi:hypothetical protein
MAHFVLRASGVPVVFLFFNIRLKAALAVLFTSCVGFQGSCDGF